jgi:hypothetical protein
MGARFHAILAADTFRCSVHVPYDEELRAKASDSRGVNFATAGLYAAIGLAMLASVMPGRRAPRDLLLEAGDVEH